ncbi:MAG: hypothetical protein JRH06_00210 [Deltaproteobacteria bacterium]|nr:hypothetical protein [Deltaproteobacteria bacterium]MBW2135962.1 hypothetical protein [Deltaproteobacteria bacterium]
MTEMWFRLHPPFGNRKVGDRKVWEEIALEAPITVKDFLARLEALHPELSDHICVEEEETFHHLLLSSLLFAGITLVATVPSVTLFLPGLFGLV